MTIWKIGKLALRTMFAVPGSQWLEDGAAFVTANSGTLVWYTRTTWEGYPSNLLVIPSGPHADHFAYASNYYLAECSALEQLALIERSGEFYDHSELSSCSREFGRVSP